MPFIKIFMVFDSGLENVIVTGSISGGLIYGDSYGRKDRAGNQKTDALLNLYSVSRSINPTNIQTVFTVPLPYGPAAAFQ